MSGVMPPIKLASTQQIAVESRSGWTGLLKNTTPSTVMAARSCVLPVILLIVYHGQYPHLYRVIYIDTYGIMNSCMKSRDAQHTLDSYLEDPAAIVSARALVLSPNERTCLLLERSSFHRANVGLLEHPGGKLEPEEKTRGTQGVIQGMLRETLEESGFATRYERGLWILNARPATESICGRLVVGGIVSIESGSLRNFSEELLADPAAEPEHTSGMWHPLSAPPHAHMTEDTVRLITAYTNPVSLPCIPTHRRNAVVV